MITQINLCVKLFSGAAMNQLSYALVLGILIFSYPVGISGAEENKPRMVDTVIASVEGEPITLSELCSQLDPPKQLSLKEAASDPEAVYQLDMMILEKLVEIDAEAKRVSVNDKEVDNYIDEIASRNNLTRDDFIKALAEQGKDFKSYRKQIRLEILRSKLIGKIMRESAGVSEAEIDRYIKDNPELNKSGTKVKLSQILVFSKDRDPLDAQNKIEKAKKRLMAGESFEEIAREFSESPEGAEGGSLGVIAEEDLSTDIFEAVFGLEEGGISDIIQSSVGYHLFKVEKRFVGKDSTDSETLRAEVRKQLREQQLLLKQQSYFASEIYAQYSVEKNL